MKKLICLLLQICVIFPLRALEPEQSIHEIESGFIKQMEDEYGLICSGTMRSMPGGEIRDFGLKFRAYRRATVEEARVLEVAVQEKFVQAVNAHERIHSYLVVDPFPTDRARISITFYNPLTGRPQADGSVYMVSHVSSLAETEYKDCNVYCRRDAYRDEIVDICKEPYPEACLKASSASLEHVNTPQEEAFDAFAVQATRNLRRNHRVRVAAIGCDQTESMGELHATLVSQSSVDLERARLLGVSVVESLLEELKEAGKPFSAESLRVRLQFRTRKNHLYYGEKIDSVFFDKGKVTYLVTPPKGEYYLSEVLVEEGYAEAFAIWEERQKKGIVWRNLSLNPL